MIRKSWVIRVHEDDGNQCDVILCDLKHVHKTVVDKSVIDSILALVQPPPRGVPIDDYW